ncbi:MAG: hypothetical protein VX910_00375 [Candidatus Latescibacterota bacterium]|nr:hypothetical protein [Candidatus Latescibacterota bacterium]
MNLGRSTNPTRAANDLASCSLHSVGGCYNFIWRDIDWLSKEEKDLDLGSNAYGIWWK